MKIIENWRQAWRWFSVQAMALLVVLPMVWMELPPDVKAMIPTGWAKWIVAGIALAGLAGRFVDQKKKAP